MRLRNLVELGRRSSQVLIVGALAVAGIALTPAVAATPEQWAQCNGQERERARQACGEILSEKGLAPATRAKALIGRGIAHHNARNWDAALADFDEALRLVPNYSSALLRRGNTHAAKGNRIAAIEDFTKVIEADRTDHVAHSNRGVAYVELRRFPLAAADFDTALRLKPDYVQAHTGRGAMLREQRRYDDSITAYSRAIELNPQSVSAWQGRANSQRLKGDLDAATSDITRALQINPNSAALRNDLGLIFVQLRQFTRAVEQYDAALRLAPDTAVTYSNRAISHRRLGNYQQAFADFEQAIRLRPDNPEAWAQRANLKVIVRDHAGALVDAEQAIRIRSNYSFAFNVKGLARAGLGDFASALKEFDEAIGINAQNPVYFANRGEIFEKQGDGRRALEDFTRAVDLPGGLPDLEVAQNRARQMRDALLLAQGRAIPPPTVNVPPAGAKPQPPGPAGKVIEAARPAPGQGILIGVPKSIGTRRIALIIGNSAYRFAGALTNPRNDAGDVAAEFRRLGFSEVVERYDLTLVQLADELKKFGDLAEKADWAVVYYAGHGMEVDGINYLVPIDAQLKKASHISDEALPLDRLVSKVEGAAKLRLVILDACRNNPFSTKAERDTRTRTIGKGLASIEPDGGTLIAFAARGGTEALDGDGRNSPYAQSLLRHLREPGLDVRFLFDKVRDSVQAQTKRVQVPFTYGSLPPEQFIFKE